MACDRNRFAKRRANHLRWRFGRRAGFSPQGAERARRRASVPQNQPEARQTTLVRGSSLARGGSQRFADNFGFRPSGQSGEQRRVFRAICETGDRENRRSSGGWHASNAVREAGVRVRAPWRSADVSSGRLAGNSRWPKCRANSMARLGRSAGLRGGQCLDRVSRRRSQLLRRRNGGSHFAITISPRRCQLLNQARRSCLDFRAATPRLHFEPLVSNNVQMHQIVLNTKSCSRVFAIKLRPNPPPSPPKFTLPRTID